MAVKPIPDAYRGVTSYLIAKNAARAIDYYVEAFGAEVVMKMEGPGGKIMHSELRIASGHIMLADEFPEMGARSPESLGGSPVSFLIYVAEDVDGCFDRAIQAGGTVLRPVKDQFYGDRSGTFRDPFGHVWTIATHIEDVPEDEMGRRAEAAMKECGEG
jgi:PhnB protein